MTRSVLGLISLLALAFFSCTSYQEKDAPVGFSVNREELSFPQNGESQSVTVASGTKWDVTSMPSWISLRSINRSGVSPYEWSVDFYSAANEEYDRDGKIVFKSQNGSSEVTVTQEGKKGRYVAVESVNLSKTELTMTVGESVALTYGIIPSDASIKDVSWESESTAIATVTQSGQIDAISEGNAIITVKTKDGGKTASCTVTVKPVAVSSVTLDKETLSLKIGETYSLIATVLPESAANKKVSWSSSNKSVATVDETGKVTATGVGSAKITVTTEDGGKTASCSVSVSSIPVTGVSLNKASLSLTIGGTEQLIATVAPTNATNKNVTWSSSNSNVATVDSNGSVSAIKVGVAIITATTEDGGKTETCSVTVNPIAVTGISLNQTNLTMTVGDSQTLTSTVTPTNATDKSVTWSSSNTSVATVSNSGVVTAKSSGSATITVTTNDGGKNATCSVTVQAQTISVTGVSLNKTSLSMKVGDTQTLTATVTPSNASNKSVTWYSYNTSVASVSSSGVVIANSAGTATIIVQTNDGGKTATCYVTVSKATPIPNAVDLGLPSGLKWASFNLGASKPEEYGDYYAWGETGPYYSSLDPLTWKDGRNYGHNWGSYKWSIGTDDHQTKYCTNSNYGYNGFTDGKTVLDPEDDAAHVNLGGKWRMPIDAEWTELKECCTWIWATQNGVNGYKVIGPNNNSIFLPAAGILSNYKLYYADSSGNYWSSSVRPDTPVNAWTVYYDSASVSTKYRNRCIGLSVRPVSD